MKILLSLILCLYFPLSVFSQCDEPSIENSGEIIAVQNFEIGNQTRQNERVLTIEAAAENSSWGAKDAESAVLTIFVDGKYSQDVLLFAGAEKFSYRAALGKFTNGKHKVTVVLNKVRSAKNVGQVKIYAFSVEPHTPKSAADHFAAGNAPILYLRPDTIDKFSDIPLIAYYEVFPANTNSFKIRYTTIFTNEDGGTQTAALMARWGRGTDIEWVYEIEVKNGAIVSEIFQGANHETKKFGGKRIFGSHPLIYDATVNNNFADSGCSALRMALLPVRADLSKKSRETVMDENAWTYRIMAQELMRENRVNAEELGENTIADLRDYVYAEVYNESQNTAIAVEMKMPDAKVVSSDDGRENLRVNRTGFSRIALRMPQTLRGKFPPALAIGCYEVSKKTDNQESVCRNLNLIKIVRLDENFRPLEATIAANPKNVKAGEKAVFEIPIFKQ